jgi:uncharacterized phosphosugar-binding protein
MLQETESAMGDRKGAAYSYLTEVSRLLRGAFERNAEQLRVAAHRCAAAIGGGGLVHLFGVGHSALAVLELFPRYGSYLGFNPVVDPRLLWTGVGTPGGVPGMRFLEHADGYADVLLRSVPIAGGDVLVVFSHGLRGTVVRQAISYARARGCQVVAISSWQTAQQQWSQGRRKDADEGPDFVIDTGVPPSDTLVEITGARCGLGAGSTVIATALGLALVCAVGEELLAQGHDLVQSERTGGGLSDSDWAFYEGFEAQLRRAWERA